jgi:hypothetical protein
MGSARHLYHGSTLWRHPLAAIGSRIKSKSSLIAFMVLYLAMSPLRAWAQEPAGKEAVLTTPPNPVGPTEVYIDLFDVEILSINEREETFEIDAYLYAEWLDGRLAFDPDLFGSDQKVYQGQTALEKFKDEIWWPDLALVDARGPRDVLNATLTIDYDGLVGYTERFRVFIIQPFYLDEFPFDSHTISLTLEPFYYQRDQVIFLEPEEGREDLAWETNEWRLSDPRTFMGPASPQDVDEDDHPFANITFEIDIERLANYYMSNVILPLLLIVAISWVVFWMDFSTMTLADRLSVSFTGVLTIVAFDFVTSDSLPKLSYPTLLDNLLAVSYVFLGLTILENVIGHILVRRKRSAAANRLDVACRYLFPVGFYGAIGFLFVTTVWLN